MNTLMMFKSCQKKLCYNELEDSYKQAEVARYLRISLAAVFYPFLKV